MYEQTNTMMETKTLFQIPQLLDGDDFTSEDLADDMEGLRLSFTRIKIPGGGHLQFEIPSGNPDVPDYAPYLEGVILYSHNSNAYWPEGSEYDDDQPPLCQSFDGKVGYGEPGGTCADCVLNQFGSDGNNKGKACKNMRMLYLLRSGEYMPIQIALPPTSLTPYTRFVNEAFLSRRRKVCTGVVRIGLKKAVTNTASPPLPRSPISPGKTWRIFALTRMASWRRSRTSTRRERRRAPRPPASLETAMPRIWSCLTTARTLR